MTFFRPTWVEISPNTFASNLHALQRFVGPRVKILAVLKADAYGHGAAALASTAVKNGAAMIGLSSLEEAMELRTAGIKAPLLLLGGVFPLENFDQVLHYGFIPTIASFKAAQAFLKACAKRGRKTPFHLKVDTGMGRIGVSVEEAKKILAWLAADRIPHLGGVYSHLSSADSNSTFTSKQIRMFQSVKDFAQNLGFDETVFHLANSTGALGYRSSHHDMIRPGLALYGGIDKQKREGPALSPVLSWQSKIIFLKKVPPGTPISYGRTFVTKKRAQIATCPVGYADGVPRSVSNKGMVLVKGKKCPIVGRVTMDHIMVDVTGLAIPVGEKVTLIGLQGRERLTASDWARWAGTIPYEIFCGISKRVPRVLI